MTIRVARRRLRCFLTAVFAFGLLLPAPVDSAPACDVGSIAWQVDQAVPPQYVEEIKEGIALADTYFKEMFGRTVCTPTIVRILAGEATGGVAVAGPGALIQIGTGHPWWRTSAQRHERMKVVVHEYFHILQYELSESWTGTPNDQVPRAGPRWLSEGSGDLIAWKALDRKGLISYADLRTAFIRWVKGAPPIPLSSMETWAGFSVPRFPSYELSVFATEFLTQERGLPSLTTYYEKVGSRPWSQAFQEVFGRNVFEFYREFEEYRKAF